MRIKKTNKIHNFTLDMKHKNQLKTITDEKKEINYFLNTGEILFDYYTNLKETARGTTNQIIKNDTHHRTIIDYFKQNIATNEFKSDRGNLLNKYLVKTENEVSNSFSEKKHNFCSTCRMEMLTISSEGVIVCPNCGHEEKYFIQATLPSYKDPPSEITHFAYKRINHFNEWLAQFQAKESTEIPERVYEKVFLELKKEKNLTIKKLTASKLRLILKKCKLNKYYEHIPHILSNINNQDTPVMDRATEEKLRTMFKEIQAPFLKNCPKNRKNFLSYSYVLHKFVQLLGLDQFLPCFPLLKSREKLQQQDSIWKKICKEVNYQFIKSI